MESANVKRLILVGAIDVRTRDKGWPKWYDEKDSEWNLFTTLETRFGVELVGLGTDGVLWR